ncbi:hypothetical protein V757_11295 [Pelistega indica]|uniref:DUF3540 domain-containing protein n=1 Tax=Pelistega indica TaxID=1414851 RepID=V8FT82_9BURK|nr:MULTISPECIES: DUF3540 domain-containing protein [Pelistega]ETD67474.1 hypothetical protein V757_11295 [Pelistega indica]
MSREERESVNQSFVAAENELARLLHHGQSERAHVLVPIHTAAKVVGIHKETQAIEVCLDGAVISIKKAASCLLMPAVNDVVLVSGADINQAYVIAVLEQANTAQQEIAIAGNVLVSASSLTFKSEQLLSMESAQITLKAQEAHCVVEQTQFVGKEMKATIGLVQLVGKVYEAIVDRLSHMSKRAFRITEQTEQVRVGTLDYQAENSARIHAKYTMVTAKDLVKVDSDQIHMG